jgi:outer membrane lipoprotein-sorting protein
MKSFSSLVKNTLLGASVLAFSTIGSMNLSAQTVDDVVAKINDAAGGVAKQKAVKTMSTEMELIMQGGAMKIPLKAIQKRPAMLYTEASFQGMQMKTAYDGKGGWQINPFQGQNKPAAMNEEEIKQNEEQADMDGEFIDSKEKGYKVELMGKEDLDGSMAYKLKVVNKHGDIKYRFFDAESYLPIKTVSKVKTKEGGESESETYFSDFKKFGGLTFACSAETKVKGETQSRMVIKNVELDKAVDDKIFVAPAEVAKPAAKPADKK